MLFMCREELIELIKNISSSISDNVANKVANAQIEKVIQAKFGKKKEVGYIEHRIEYGPSGYPVYAPFEVEQKDATGVFKQIDDLEKKVEYLEKFLKISVVKEKTEFEGYKPISATKAKPGRKVTKRKR